MWAVIAGCAEPSVVLRCTSRSWVPDEVFAEVDTEDRYLSVNLSGLSGRKRCPTRGFLTDEDAWTHSGEYAKHHKRKCLTGLRTTSLLQNPAILCHFWKGAGATRQDHTRDRSDLEQRSGIRFGQN